MTSATSTARPRPGGHRRPRPQPQPAPKFRGDIEGMRALAVGLVVLFHAGVPFVPGGYVGVDVFFVLSGFLITGLLVDELRRDGRISFTGFYARRVRRLLPMAAVVLASTVAAAHWLVAPVDRGGVGKDVASAAVWVANWHFAGESTQYMADVNKSPVLHFWSLSVEEQFYVVWPLLLLCLAGGPWLARRSWRGAMSRVAVGLGVIGAVSLLLSWHLTSTGASAAYYGLHTRAWELGLGAGIALARPLLPRIPRPAAAIGGWIGLGMVVGSALLLSTSTPFPGLAALWPVVGTGLLVATGVRLGRTGPPALLDRPVPRFVGRISYAWYLWHWPCIVLANSYWGTPRDTGEGATSTAFHASAPVVLLAVAVSFVLAVVTHFVVEQPLRHARWFVVSRPRSLQLGAVAVAVCLAVAWTLKASPADDTVVSAVPASSEPVSAAPDGSDAAAGSRSPRAARDAQSVRMTAAQARKDLPTPRRGCYVGYAGTTVPSADACRYGPADGKRTIVLIGDSHATQWEPALEQVAERLDWTVYFFAKTACSVVDTPIWVSQEKGPYTACATWRARMLDRVASIKGLDAVVIGRWSDYRRLALAPDGSRVESDSLFASVWEKGARRTFEALADVPRIIVVRDTPKAPQDIPTCLSLHPKKPTACSFDTADAAHRDGALLAAEAKAGGDRLRTIDLTDVICPEPRCQVVTANGIITYRDEHHLSATFGATLWKVLADRISEQLPASHR